MVLDQQDQWHNLQGVQDLLVLDKTLGIRMLVVLLLQDANSKELKTFLFSHSFFILHRGEQQTRLVMKS